MKGLSFLVLFFLIISTQEVNAQEKVANAIDIFDAALEKANHENKLVFIMFEASWCGWCKRMDKSMKVDSVKDYFSRNFVVAHMVVHESQKNKNLENPGALEMLEKYGGAQSGIPYWLIFNSKGELLADSRMPKDTYVLKGEGNNLGCPASKEEVAGFLYKLKHTTDLTAAELEEIRAVFRLNDPTNK